VAPTLVQATSAIHFFRLDLPFFRNSSFLRFIVFLGGNKCFAVAAGYSTECNHSVHALTSLKQYSAASIKLVRTPTRLIGFPHNA
jgi:hypothetical protein